MNRTLLASAICASLLVASTAYAQDTAAPQPAQDQSNPQTLQTITVTGTHIRQAQLATAQPVISVTRAEIEHQGFTSVADILQNLTVAGSPPISRQSVLLSGEAVGGYYIDIHNLGASRTLVLLNGKRLGTTEGGLADLQQIPTSAIERIEVLKDGASAIYGSDAISGVVNIITRDHFTGAEASAYVGEYDENSDGMNQVYSMTMGAQSAKGSIMFSAEYAKQDPVYDRNRWFSRNPDGPYHPNDGWTIVSQYGAFFNYNINPPYNLYGGGWCDPGNYDLCTPNAGGNPSNPADYHITNGAGGTSDLSNTNEIYMLQTGTEHKSLFVSGTWDFTDHVHFRTNLLYNRRNTFVDNAGYPFQPAFTLPGSSDVIGLSPDSYFNPFGNGPNGNGEGDTVWFYRRGWEVDRTTDNQLTTYRIGGTFSGDFNIGEHNWNWDIGGYSNENRALVTSRGNFSLIATSQALGPSYLNADTGRVECGSAADPIPYGTAPGNCVPWNPLIPAGSTGPGSLTGNPDLQTFLFPNFHDTGVVKTTDYSANLTGSILTLPAGDLAVAVGAEYRQEKGNFIPDAFRQGGLSTDLSSGPTGGEYTVKSEYVEVSVPLLKDIPAFQSLSLDAALRHSKYSSFGTTNNAKFSLTWRPIEDLLIGGTFAHGFRAPQIADLFGGLGGTFDSYSDPCDPRRESGSNSAVAQRCTSGFGGQPGVPAGYQQLGQGGAVCKTLPCQTGIQFLAGANPNLDPEKSLSRTAQIVYSPSWFPSAWGKVDISVDYFNITITDAIVGDSVNSMLHDCYVLGVASRCSSALFTRDPNTGVLNYALRGEKNAGLLESKGWDLGINYAFPQTAFGQFKLNFAGTYWSQQNSKADNSPTTPLSHNNGFDSNFRYRMHAGLDWSMGPWGATWNTRFYSGFKEDCSYDTDGGPECNMPNYIDENGVASPVRTLGSTTFNDLQVRYAAPWKGTISLGVNNIFDKFGPIVYGGSRTTVVAYNPSFDIGRFYYVRYVQKF